MRRVLRKKNIFALVGYRRARKVHMVRIRYSRNKAVNPTAAFRFVSPRCRNMLIKTLYVASLVEKLVSPIIAGTWPTAMLRAEPVMKAEMAAKVMNSTIQPSRARPRKRTIEPATMAKDDAMISFGTSGNFAAVLVTTFPVTVERTATGPIVMSLDVAKNQ